MEVPVEGDVHERYRKQTFQTETANVPWLTSDSSTNHGLCEMSCLWW